MTRKRTTKEKKPRSLFELTAEVNYWVGFYDALYLIAKKLPSKDFKLYGGFDVLSGTTKKLKYLVEPILKNQRR